MNDTERSSSPNESRFEKWLIKKLHRVACPDTLELSEYAGGMLSGTELIQVKTHLEACPKCRQELAFLQTFLDESTLLDETSIARKIANQVSTQTAIWIAQLKKAGSDLSEMGGGDFALAGIRGEAPRQLVYAVNAIQIVMEIEDDAEYVGRKQVIGLITGLEPTFTYSVRLIQTNQLVITAPIVRGANFLLTNLLPGSYQLQIVSTQIEIHLNNVAI